jgi:hypothetical protein
MDRISRWLFRKPLTTRTATTARRSRLGCEALERRDVPSTTYDVAADFLSAPDPTSPWRYGRAPAGGGEFSPDVRVDLQDGLTAWGAPGSDPLPAVFQNSRSQAGVFFGTIGLAAGEVALHPGSQGQHAIVRFTAPEDGSYLVTAAFAGRDADFGGTDAHIRVNDVEIFGQEVTAGGSASPPPTTLHLTAGATVDFRIGFGANGTYYSDSTGLAATIVKTDTETWDAAADFSPTSNPNGAWRYGYAGGLTVPYAPFTLGAGFTVDPGVPGWGAGTWDHLPGVFQNTTAQTVHIRDTVTLPAGELALHPGVNGEYGVVRFVAPRDGAYTVTAGFGGRDNQFGGTDAHVLAAGEEVFAAPITAASGADMAPTTVSLLAGESIDFAVGYGSNGTYFNDTTALSATVTYTGAAQSVSIQKVADTAEGSSTPGRFRVTRTGSTAQSLVVRLAPPSGTATSGTDYAALPATVTIPAGSTSADVTVSAFTDTRVEGPETVRLGIRPGSPAYVVAGTGAADLTIADDVDLSGDTVNGMQGVKLALVHVASYLNDETDDARLAKVGGTVNWGDGTQSEAWIEKIANSPDQYEVYGVHTYDEDGNYTIDVDLTYDNQVVGTTTSAADIVQFLATNDQYYMSHDRDLVTGDDAYGPGVLGNDQADGLSITDVDDPEHGTLYFDRSTGNFAYSPADNFVGADSFTYTVQYGGTSSEATVSIVVSNGSPVASDDEYYIAPLESPDPSPTSYTTRDDRGDGLVLDGSLLGNDFDAEDALTVVGHTQPLHGTVNMGADGTFVYIPDVTFAGEDSFLYTVSDGVEQSTATASIAVDDGTYLPEPGVLAYSPAPPATAGDGQPAGPVGQPAAPGVSWADAKATLKGYKDLLGQAIAEARVKPIQILGNDENNALWINANGQVWGATLLGDPGAKEKPQEYGIVHYRSGVFRGFYYTPQKDREGKLIKYQELAVTKDGVKGTYVDASGAVVTFDKVPTKIQWEKDGVSYSVSKDEISISGVDDRPLDKAQFFVTLSKQPQAKLEYKIKGGAGVELSTSGVKLTTTRGYSFAANWHATSDFKAIIVDKISASMMLDKSNKLDVGYARPQNGGQPSFSLTYTNPQRPDQSVEIVYKPMTAKDTQKFTVTVKLKWPGGPQPDAATLKNLGITFGLEGNKATFGMSLDATF